MEAVTGESFQHLQPGKRYRVMKAFEDFDRETHPVGEEWTYIGTSFLPYDDGRSLFVTVDGHDCQIRMQDRPEEQGPVLAQLHEYVVEA